MEHDSNKNSYIEKLKEGLQFAIENDNRNQFSEILKELKEENVNLNFTNNLGQTPLVLSIAKDKLHFTEQLLKEDVNPNSKDLMDVSPLQYLINYEGLDFKNFDLAFKNLIDKGADLKKNANLYGNIFTHILDSGKKQALYTILHSDVKMNLEDIKNAVFAISRAKSSDFQEDIPKNSMQYNSLTGNQTKKALNILANKFIEKTLREEHPRNYSQVIDMFKNMKDNHGRTPIINSIIYGNQHAFNYWLSSDVDVTIKDKQGKSALNYLCSSLDIKDEDITRSIYEKLTYQKPSSPDKTHNKASYGDVSLEQNFSQKDIIASAIKTSKFQLARWLYDDGIKPNPKNEDMFSQALIKLAQENENSNKNGYSQKEKLNDLINYGANPDKIAHGKLALNEAIKSGNLELALGLIKNNASVHLKDSDNSNALDLIVNKQNPMLKTTENHSKHIDKTPENQSENIVKELLNNLVKNYFKTSDLKKATVETQKEADKYVKEAMNNNNFLFLETMVRFGYDINKEVASKNLKTYSLENNATNIIMPSLEKTLTNSPTYYMSDKQKEIKNKKSWNSKLYNELLSIGNFKLSSTLKENAQKYDIKLDYNITDNFGRNAFLNMLKHDELELANAFFENNNSNFNFMKKDIFGDNCLHYLSFKNHKDSPVEDNFGLFEEREKSNENARKKLLNNIIKKIKIQDSSISDSMLSKETLAKYFETSVASKNTTASKIFIEQGVLDHLKDTVGKDIWEGRTVKTEDYTQKQFQALYLISTLVKQASSKGDIELLEKIYNSGFDINSKSISTTSLNETALSSALKNANFKTSLWLLKNGAEPNTKNAFGQNALESLCSSKDLEVNLTGFNDNSENSIQNYTKLLHQLLSRTEGLHQKGGFARLYLHEAIKSNNFELARNIVTIGSNIKPRDETHDMKNNSKKLTAEEFPYFFSESVPVPNSSISVEDIFKLDLQLMDGYKTTTMDNKYYANALTNEVAMSNKREVEKLLSIGVDVNTKDKDYKTALMYCAAYSNNDMLNYLIEKKADIHLVDRHGKNALDYAIEKGNISNALYIIQGYSNLKPKKENAELLDYFILSDATSLNKDEKSKIESRIIQTIGSKHLKEIRRNNRAFKGIKNSIKATKVSAIPKRTPRILNVNNTVKNVKSSSAGLVL